MRKSRQAGTPYAPRPTPYGQRGQASTEMVMIVPLLIGLIGGGFFLIYTAWQGVKVQQAANLAARIQGEERVNGSRTKDDINKTNGVGPDSTFSAGDPDPEVGANAVHGPAPSDDSVYGKFYNAVMKLFSNSKEVWVPPPHIGQNVDTVNVIRVMNVPKVPFLKDWMKNQNQIKLKATAYGGEDPFMYGLPRWGTTGEHPNNTDGNSLEWRQIIRGSGDGDH